LFQNAGRKECSFPNHAVSAVEGRCPVPIQTWRATVPRRPGNEAGHKVEISSGQQATFLKRRNSWKAIIHLEFYDYHSQDLLTISKY
jgi:hypothetical protein